MKQQSLFGAEFERKADLSQWYTPPYLSEIIYIEARLFALKHYAKTKRPCRILEPAAGRGALILPWTKEEDKPFFRWIAYDCDPNNTREMFSLFQNKKVRKTFVDIREGDYLASSNERFDLTIANPPYENDLDSEFVMCSLEQTEVGYFLLRSVFDQSQGRWEKVWRWVNPEKEIRLISRPSFGSGGSGSTPKSDFKIWFLSKRKRARKVGDVFNVKVVWK